VPLALISPISQFSNKQKQPVILRAKSTGWKERSGSWLLEAFPQ
jgi:hypothetical protein